MSGHAPGHDASIGRVAGLDVEAFGLRRVVETRQISCKGPY